MLVGGTPVTVSSSNESGPEINGLLKIYLSHCTGLTDSDYFSQNDNEVRIKYGVNNIWHSKISYGSNPTWNQETTTFIGGSHEYIEVNVVDIDTLSYDHLGTVKIPIETILDGDSDIMKYTLLDAEGEPCGNIYLGLKYLPASDDKTTNFQAYKPERDGNEVKLFTNSHCRLPDGEVDVDNSCWIQIYQGLVQAEKFIYITGWSVYHQLKLLRSTASAIGVEDEETLGELLLRKAREGVSVKILLWDELTSSTLSEGLSFSLMATGDEETYQYFLNTEVTCLKATRNTMVGVDIDAINSQLYYTHHQKTIIYDGPHGYEAFVGGLDLAKGRFDDERHLAYIDDDHIEDFHQAMIMGVSPDEGPRQPWQDIHSWVKGPCVYDILNNFIERWIFLTKVQFPDWIEDAYKVYKYNINTESNADSEVSEDEPCDSGVKVQVLRSIDSRIAALDVRRQNALRAHRKYWIESSIHEAYINHIRSAEDYILIENQYFFGSSFAWDPPQAGCKNQVPWSIVEKIKLQMSLHKRFRVVIILPLHPEGDPTSSAVQECLRWQLNTMHMMYGQLYSAANEFGEYYINEDGDEVPQTIQDILQFYTLLQKHNEKIVPIYVHSKFMAVDSDYVIVGSANINDRSLRGSRDSEIALGIRDWDGTKEFVCKLISQHIGESLDSEMDVFDMINELNNRGENNLESWKRCDSFSVEGHICKYPDDFNHLSESFYDPEVLSEIGSSGFLCNSITM